MLLAIQFLATRTTISSVNYGFQEGHHEASSRNAMLQQARSKTILGHRKSSKPSISPKNHPKAPFTQLCLTMFHLARQSLTSQKGSPTNVRRVDISDALPGLTDSERKYLREKASSDAIHLLGMQSLPPSHPATSPPSPTLTSSAPPSLCGPASRLTSREPSEALLNAASKDLPSALPTPPKQRHNESSPPAARMKGMWETTRRVSESSSVTNDELYEKLERVKGERDSKPKRTMNESFSTLNLEVEWECGSRKGSSETARTVSFHSGFEVQGTIGGGGDGRDARIHTASPVSMKTVGPGTTLETTPIRKSPVIHRAITSKSLADSCSSDSESDVAFEEASPLVKI
ncbi:hypothetical protein FB567DRAFT_522536 [Paraphoma chrysanthemicola]|uniref:Uncharacterized protein n=1 Tax=Paraphoma chrysanthemicola TaxID=798071 RepID=A0A8K0W0M3_9PLEO|nr:hypothetical protein FB567DRAFT_522536 [Paraphoma chrysanthemicola]